MRNLIIGLLFFAFVAPAAADFDSHAELSEWLTFYYQSPDIARFPEAIEYMGQSGMLGNKEALAPVFGFISGIFADNPTHVSAWIDRFGALKEEHLGVVVLGLWYANLPESQEQTYALLDRHPNLSREFAFLRNGTPMPLEAIPLEQGAWVLDALWGKFLATGKKEPVERIMAALPWADVKGNINRLVIGGAARWSLTSNAVQHDRVFDICEAALASQSKDVVLKLEAVLDDARKERSEQKNQSALSK